MVNQVIKDFVENGLCNVFHNPTNKELPGARWEITTPKGSNISYSLRDRSYEDVYQVLVESNTFHIRMIDGALLQFMYRFHNKEIESHRLAFFPSPSLDEVQNTPSMHEDEILSYLLSRNITLPFPIRFDFNRSTDADDKIHPKSHLTIGQYQDCRIPVSAPLTPYHFTDFIVQNFYGGIKLDLIPYSSQYSDYFEESLIDNERRRIYLQIPIKG